MITSNSRDALYNELVQLLCNNSQLFPAVDHLKTLLSTKHLSDQEARSLLHYEVSNYIGLRYIFEQKCQALADIWMLSPVDQFSSLKTHLLRSCAGVYLLSFPSYNEAEQFRQLFDNSH